MIMSSTAIWQGSGKDGIGNVSTQSKILTNVFFSWDTEKYIEYGTNPVELLASAHAISFTVMLGDLLTAEKYKVERIETVSDVTMDKVITGANLFVNVKVPSISNKRLEELAESARRNCQISRILNIPITMEVFIIPERVLDLNQNT